MALDARSQFGPIHWSRGASREPQKGKTDALKPAAPSEPWSEDDLIALAQLRSVGVPIDHVAAYLGRTVAEVEEKAGLPSPPKGASPVIRAAHHQVARCYQLASECRAKGAGAFNEAAKQEYLDMEHRWLMLARSYELSERITDYSNEVPHRLCAVKPREQRYPAIPRVYCPECGKRMRLAYVEPCADERRSADTSMFTCECGFGHKLTIDRRTRVASATSPSSKDEITETQRKAPTRVRKMPSDKASARRKTKSILDSAQPR